MDGNQLTQFLVSLDLGVVFLGVTGAFVVLYFGFAFAGVLLRTRLLPSLGVGAVLDARVIPPGQIAREVRLSLVSCATFGAYGVLTLLALRHGLVAVTTELSAAVIVMDFTLIFFWNELHFYVCHRFLHRPWFMKRVHVAHHRSRVPTPFSTYSFHWFEGALLGSVMLSAMMLHNFHVLALLLLPVLSILGNSAGHLNYELFPTRSSRKFLSMTRRHGAHHALATKNYAFLLSWPDRVFGTEILPRAETEPLRTLPRLVNDRSKYVVGLLLLVFISLAYNSTNQHPLYEPIQLTPGPLDHLVPLLPWTAWIYATFPAFCVIVFVRETDMRLLNHFVWAAIAMNLATEAIFLLLPTTLDRSASLMTPIAEGGSSLLAHIQSFDRPTNCLPSLHVSGTVLPAMIAWKRQQPGFRWLALWAALVCLSTLTTKQHLLPDVLSGALLATFTYWYFFNRVRFPEPSNALAEAPNV